MNLQQIHHFALVVDDLDASVQWYAEMLGFRLERRFGFPEAGIEIAHVVTGDIRFELIQQSGSAASPDAGLNAFTALHTRGAKHVGLLVGDIEAAASELRAKGVEFVHDVATVEPAGVRNLWVRDNSGNLIEFNQWLPDSGVAGIEVMASR